MNKKAEGSAAQTPTTLTRKQLAAMLGVSRATMARMDRAGTGPGWFTYPGSTVVRYLRRDVDAWLAKMTSKSAVAG